MPPGMVNPRASKLAVLEPTERQGQGGSGAPSLPAVSLALGPRGSRPRPPQTHVPTVMGLGHQQHPADEVRRGHALGAPALSGDRGGVRAHILDTLQSPHLQLTPPGGGPAAGWPSAALCTHKAAPRCARPRPKTGTRSVGKAAELLSTEGNDRMEEKRCEAPGVQCWVGGPGPGRQQLWSPLPPLPGARQAALAQAGAASHHSFLSYIDPLPGHPPPPFLRLTSHPRPVTTARDGAGPGHAKPRRAAPPPRSGPGLEASLCPFSSQAVRA